MLDEIDQIKKLLDVLERKEHAPKNEESQQLEYVLKRLDILEKDLSFVLVKPGKPSYRISVEHARSTLLSIRNEIDNWKLGIKPEYLKRA
jgi:flagellar assembly factor FliW